MTFGFCHLSGDEVQGQIGYALLVGLGFGGGTAGGSACRQELGEIRCLQRYKTCYMNYCHRLFNIVMTEKI
jgi:hypothetical protein